MTPYRYAVIVLRAFALYSGIVALGWLPWTYVSSETLLYRLREHSLGMLIAVVAIAIIVPLCCAWMIWDRAPRFASRIIDDGDPEDGEEREGTARGSLTQQQILALVITSLGLWAIVSSLPHLLSACIEGLRSYAATASASDGTIRVVIAEAPRLLLGMWLTLRGRGVVAFILRLRGRDPESILDDEPLSAGDAMKP